METDFRGYMATHWGRNWETNLSKKKIETMLICFMRGKASGLVEALNVAFKLKRRSWWNRLTGRIRLSHLIESIRRG